MAVQPNPAHSPSRHRARARRRMARAPPAVGRWGGKWRADGMAGIRSTRDRFRSTSQKIARWWQPRGLVDCSRCDTRCGGIDLGQPGPTSARIPPTVVNSLKVSLRQACATGCPLGAVATQPAHLLQSRPARLPKGHAKSHFHGAKADTPMAQSRSRTGRRVSMGASSLAGSSAPIAA